MTIPMQCVCGAKLEIDDKFAGQTIHCPDCNRPLAPTVPVPPPERTSGWALASFITALVGGFTIVGGIAAALLGAFALRSIARSPEPLGGRRFALAGIAIGGFLSLVSLGMLYTGTTFGVDGLLRVLEWAGKVEYPAELVLTVRRSGIDIGDDYTIKRPSAAWGKLVYKSPNASPNVTDSDDLILVNVREDAYITCLTKVDHGANLDILKTDGKARFDQSELVHHVLGKSKADDTQEEPEVQELKRDEAAGALELRFNLKLGGVERTFLLRVVKDGPKVRVLAGGARKNRFERLEPQIRAALESYKVER